MRTVFFTVASCWTEARSICSKKTFPSSANVPIKTLFGLIPSAKTSFFTQTAGSRGQMLRGWHPIQNPSTWSLSQHHPCDSASNYQPVEFLGNCGIKRVRCISHCTPDCSEAWGVKANSSPSFPHLTFSAQCHWTCLSLQIGSSRKSFREKEEKGRDYICSLLKLLCLWLQFSFQGPEKSLPSTKPTAGSHFTETGGPPSSGLQFGEASLSRKKMYMAPGRRLE